MEHLSFGTFDFDSWDAVKKDRFTKGSGDSTVNGSVRMYKEN